jgi:hypothetical protein
VAGAAKPNKAGGHERRFVDRRLVAFLEPSGEPACRDAGMPPGVLDGDQSGELERLDEGDAADLPQRRLGHEEVAAFDCSLEDPSRVALCGQSDASPGPAASASVSIQEGRSLSGRAASNCGRGWQPIGGI